MEEHRHEVRVALDLVRRHHKKRERTHVWGRVNYSCECGMQELVLICSGVMVADVFAVPAPRVIPCFVCGDEALRLSPVEILPIPLRHPPSGSSYVCIPSRRARARLIEVARFEAQLVRPREGRFDRWDADRSSRPLTDETLRQALR